VPEKFNSAFNYLLNSNELDGLTNGSEGSDNVIVETAIPTEDSEPARKAIEALLISTQPDTDESIPANID
jgi:hypothetical protein